MPNAGPHPKLSIIGHADALASWQTSMQGLRHLTLFLQHAGGCFCFNATARRRAMVVSVSEMAGCTAAANLGPGGTWFDQSIEVAAASAAQFKGQG